MAGVVSAPSPASPLGRPRIYAAKYGYAVRWLTVRTAPTLAEAQALAKLATPPPRRFPPRSKIAPETIALARELREAGTSVRGIAKELDRRGIRPPRSARWHPSSVQRLLP